MMSVTVMQRFTRVDSWFSRQSTGTVIASQLPARIMKIGASLDVLDT